MPRLRNSPRYRTLLELFMEASIVALLRICQLPNNLLVSTLVPREGHQLLLIIRCTLGGGPLLSVLFRHLYEVK